MPRYYFNFYNHRQLVARDLILPDLAAVLEECARLLREGLQDERPREGTTDGPALRVADDRGRTILNIPIAYLPFQSDLSGRETL